MILGEDQRMFVCLDWTELSVNDFGDAVGFHDHHREFHLRVIHGELINIDAFEVTRDTDVLDHSCWVWDSKPRGGEGKFNKVPGTTNKLSYRLLHTMLNPGTSGLRLRTDQLHTVKQLTKSCAWIVTEVGPSTNAPTVTWSRSRLDKWNAADKYVPMAEKEILKIESFARPVYEKAMSCSPPIR